jgi:hypothetical protein
MPYKPSEIESRLQNKFGFSPSPNHSSDHRWYELKLPGLPKIATKVSHNKKDVGSKIESKIVRQLRVSKRFFYGMMDCYRSREDYSEQVTTNPQPPFNVRF